MRDTTDLFLRASRQKFRFASPAGDLTAEQLWDLPLTSQRGASLDGVAKAVNNDLKAATEESFVTVSKNPQRGMLEAKLEVVKVVIAVKQDEARQRTEQAQKAETIRMLEQALAEKQVAELTSGTAEDLKARLAALKADTTEATA